MLRVTQHPRLDAVELDICSIQLTSGPLHCRYACALMHDAVMCLMNPRRKEILDATQKPKWEVLTTMAWSVHTVRMCITLVLFSSE